MSSGGLNTVFICEKLRSPQRNFYIHFFMMLLLYLLINSMDFYIPHTPLKGSSTSFSFTNVAPDDTKPYIMRVVVIPSTAGSTKTTIRRQIWIPGKKLRKQSKHFIHFGQRCSHQYKVQQKIVLGTTFCVYMLSQYYS